MRARIKPLIIFFCCRLVILAELEPLVTHLGQMHLELRAWLCDVSADVNALDWAAGGTGTTPDGEDRAEQLQVRQSNLKVWRDVLATCVVRRFRLSARCHLSGFSAEGNSLTLCVQQK